MYPLGHISEGYLVAWVTAGKRRSKLSLWLALTMGMLPDLDLFLQGQDLVHETYTHSLAVLVPIAFVLIAWRREALPYAAALISHDVGDLLVGCLPLLFPLSRTSFGLGLGMASLTGAIFETASLALLLTILLRKSELKRLLSGDKENFFLAVPLFLMLCLLWYTRNGVSAPIVVGIQRLVEYGFSTQALGLITFGHIVLAGIMLAGILSSSLRYLHPHNDLV